MTLTKIGSFIALLCLAIPACAQENKTKDYSLTVKIADLDNPDAKVYLSSNFSLKKEAIIDSASMQEGSFYMSGNLKEAPIQAALFINKKGNGSKKLAQMDGIMIIYLEKGDDIHVDIKGAIGDAVITGSPINTEYQAYMEATMGWVKKFDTKAVDQALANATSEEEKKVLYKKKAEISTKRTKYKDELLLDYIKRNPTSYFSLDALNTLSHKNVNLKQFTPLFNSLSSELRNSKEGVAFKEKLSRARAEIGLMAPDFEQVDENGKPIKLSDYRGKYVLVDFWASWCAPCRAENPNLVKAYEKYKDHGFEILSISLDTDREAWLKAIEEENLSWKNVSDLKGFKNEVAVQYNISSIPQNVLIDPEGKIITKNLRGYTVIDRLAEIFEK